MISNIIAHVQILNFAIFSHFDKHIFKKHVKVLLQLYVGEGTSWGMRWVLVNVWDKDGLRIQRLDVFARTLFSVTTSADFEIEGTVDLVLKGEKQRLFCSTRNVIMHQ
jgi:hypothetical protein